VLFVQNGCVWN